MVGNRVVRDIFPHWSNIMKGPVFIHPHLLQLLNWNTNERSLSAATNARFPCANVHVNTQQITSASASSSDLNLHVDPSNTSAECIKLSSQQHHVTYKQTPSCPNNGPHADEIIRQSIRAQRQQETQPSTSFRDGSLSRDHHHNRRCSPSPSPDRRGHRARSQVRSRAIGGRRSYAPSPVNRTYTVQNTRSQFNRPWDQQDSQPSSVNNRV